VSLRDLTTAELRAAFNGDDYRAVEPPPRYDTAEAVDDALAAVQARWDHGDAPYDPDVLAIIRAAETMRAKLYGPDGDGPMPVLAERELGQLIDEHDRATAMADRLAEVIARVTGVEVGEHSNMNDPWENALQAATEYAETTETAGNLAYTAAESAWAAATGRAATPDEFVILRKVADAVWAERVPTADAYERACAALAKHRERADAAEAEVKRLRAVLGELATAALETIVKTTQQAVASDAT
jgi:hypothetical protein